LVSKILCLWEAIETLASVIGQIAPLFLRVFALRLVLVARRALTGSRQLSRDACFAFGLGSCSLLHWKAFLLFSFFARTGAYQKVASSLCFSVDAGLALGMGCILFIHRKLFLLFLFLAAVTEQSVASAYQKVASSLRFSVDAGLALGLGFIPFYHWKMFLLFLLLAPAVTEQSVAVAVRGRTSFHHTGLATGFFPVLSKLGVGEGVDLQRFAAVVANSDGVSRIWLWPLWFGFFRHVAFLLFKVNSSSEAILLAKRTATIIELERRRSLSLVSKK